MCQKRFVKFRAGDFSLDDAPWSGGPIEVDRDQIETLIENNQCSTTWEIAAILKISKSIKLLAKMINVSFILWKKNMVFLANPIGKNQLLPTEVLIGDGGLIRYCFQCHGIQISHKGKDRSCNGEISGTGPT